MTSLASLAHAAAPAPRAFNHDFYVTAATVIPVLFLALAVQGRVYEGLLRAALTTLRVKRAGRDRFPVIHVTAGFRLPWLAILTVNGLLWLTAFLIPVAGYMGEQRAVTALYDGHDDSVTRPIVLFTTLFLFLVVAMGPMLTLIRVIADEDDAPGTAPLLEPGKTDTDG